MKSYSKNEKSTSHTFDEEPRASHQAPMHEILETYQRRANRTGLPDELKTGIENQSGYSMDDVNVHYNSSKPAQLNALAYTQGTDIHVAPGQEKHLPHEAWHVVQQKQGRVQPTTQMQGVSINDNEGLEKEADVMGGKVVQRKENYNNNIDLVKNAPYPIIQLRWNPTHNGNLNMVPNAVQRGVIIGLINQINAIPVGPGTIVGNNIRIDLQGLVPRPGGNWANIQIQIGGGSVAGVICPFYLTIQQIKAGLLEALDLPDILEWVEDDEEEEEIDEFKKWTDKETEDPGPKEATGWKGLWKSRMKISN